MNKTKKSLIPVILVILGILMLTTVNSGSGGTPDTEINISADAYTSTTNITWHPEFGHLSTIPDIFFYAPMDFNDTTIRDYSVTDSNGTRVLDPQFNIGEQINNSFDFPTQASRIDYEGIGNNDYFNQTFTVTAWLKPNEFKVNDAYLGTEAGFGTQNLRGWSIRQSGGDGSDTTFFGYNGSSGGSFSGAGVVLNISTWHHVAFVYNFNENITGYRDGGQEIDDQTNVDDGPLSGLGNLSIGIAKADNSLTARDVNASVDDVMIFNRSLTPSEISDIYNGNFSRFLPRGELTYTNLDANTSGNPNTLNITIIDSLTNSSSYFSGQIGNSTGSGYVYNEEFNFTSGFASGVGVSTPDNFSMRLIFNPTSNNFFSPNLINENITINSFEVESVVGNVSFTTNTPDDNYINATNVSLKRTLSIEIDVNVTDRDSTTFNLFYDNSTLVNSTILTGENNSIIFYNLTDMQDYLYNVTVNDTSNNQFSTETRNISIRRPFYFGLTSEITPLYNNLDGGNIGYATLLGDSITVRVDTFIYYFRDNLSNVYGYGGEGYLALTDQTYADKGTQNSTDILNGPKDGIDITAKTGLFNQSGVNSDRICPQGCDTVDGNWFELGGEGTMNFTTYGNTGVLQYLERPNSGSLVISVDGVQVDSIDTNKSTPGSILRNVTIDLNDTDPDFDTLHTVTLENVNSTGPNEWIQINGWKSYGLNNSGFVQGYFGRGGVPPLDFAVANETIYNDSFALDNPDLMMFLIDGESESSPDYAVNLTVIVERAEAANPDAGIVLISHPAISTGGVETDGQEMLELARDNGYGFVNFYDIVNDTDYDALYADDGTHMSEEGGIFYGNYLYELFEQEKPSGDELIPELIINSPTDGFQDEVPIFLNATLSETGSIQYTLNNGITNNSLSTSDNLEFTGHIVSADPGDYVLRFYGTDDAGNLNSTESVNLKILSGVGGTGGSSSTPSSSSDSTDDEDDGGEDVLIINEGTGQLDDIIIDFNEKFVIGQEKRIPVTAINSDGQVIDIDSLKIRFTNANFPSDLEREDIGEYEIVVKNIQGEKDQQISFTIEAKDEDITISKELSAILIESTIFTGFSDRLSNFAESSIEFIINNWMAVLVVVAVLIMAIVSFFILSTNNKPKPDFLR